MQTFEFKVLCIDKKSCDLVRNLMTDLNVIDLGGTECHDHIGTKDFENVDLAVERMNILEKDAKSKIINVILTRIK